VQRGDVIWALFEPRSGSEQHGFRPALLISNDRFNQAKHWHSLIVIPISSKSKLSPSIVCIPKNTVGLQMDSYLICHQVTVLDRSKLRDVIGQLPPELLKEVEKALLEAVGMTHE
jgi:mRNA interferase MazF